MRPWLAVAITIIGACKSRVVLDKPDLSVYTEVRLPADPAAKVSVSCDVRIFEHGVFVAYTVHNGGDSLLWVMEAPYLLRVQEDASSAVLYSSNSTPRGREELPVRWQPIPPSATGHLERKGALGRMGDYNWFSNAPQAVTCAVPYWLGDAAPTMGYGVVASSLPVTITISRLPAD